MRDEPSKGPVITRAEFALYGHGAGPMTIRRLGMALTNAEQARQVALEELGGSRDADDITRHGSNAKDGDYDEQGRSPHTAWLDTVFERLAALEALAASTHRDLAIEYAQHERARRQRIDSMPVIQRED